MVLGAIAQLPKITKGIVSLPKAAEIMEKASTMAPKAMREYFHSFGTAEKISPTQVNIGKTGGKKGLFYEESLPFVEEHDYVHKLYGKQLEKAKVKGWDPDATYTEKRYRFKAPEQEDPFVRAQKGQNEYVKVRKSEAWWDEASKKYRMPLTKKNIMVRSARVDMLIGDVITNPAKYGLKENPKVKYKLTYDQIKEGLNRQLVKEGYDPVEDVKRQVQEFRGSTLTLFKGTENEKKMLDFLQKENPKTGLPYFETTTTPELKKIFPDLKDTPLGILNISRQNYTKDGKPFPLIRTNIASAGGENPLAKAVRQTMSSLDKKLKKRGITLDDDEKMAYAEQAKIYFDTRPSKYDPLYDVKSLPVQKLGYKERFNPEEINIASNFIEDTEIALRQEYLLSGVKNLDLQEYKQARRINKLLNEVYGRGSYGIGHARQRPGETGGVFSGYEMSGIGIESWFGKNAPTLALSNKYIAAMKNGNFKVAEEVLKEMKRKGLRSSRVLDIDTTGWTKKEIDNLKRLGITGEYEFFGAPSEFGKLAKGGLINGHLTDTSSSMPQGLPLLDPQESIDRQKFAIGGFASLFGKLSKVPRAVGRFGDIKKPPKIKPPSATEVAAGQAVEDKPAMFLSTVNAIEDMPEVTMPANQWLGTIKNKPGVSATELDEFGLEALLTNISKADPKRKLSKTELIEAYNREMPKIDMDIAIAEPVSRGANDISNMLLRIRERGRGAQQLENLDIFSNDPRLLTALHQPPQDATGMKIRESIINIMRGTNKTIRRGEDPINDDVVSLLKSSYGGQNFELHKGQHFQELWEGAFPKIFHSTNEIVKRDHLNALRHLVSPDDVVNLAKSRNIPEEEAFGQLYQALNIFDRQIMTADVPIPFWTKKMLYRLGDMGEGRGFFYKSKKNPAHEGAQFIPGGSGYGEIKFYQNFDTGAVRAQEGTYKSGHFSGEVFKGNTGNSPFGWGRFSERIDESGRKILLMEEIQSDLHQGVAQKGYKYAPRLDRHDVLAEVGEFAKQLDTKKQTLESTRLRKDAIKALPRVERESEANVAELKNIEKAIKKLIGDVKKLQKKVEEQARLTGRSGQVYPDTAFKKSENYAKLFMQGLMKMANDKGYDGIALSTGKMKKAHGSIPKGGDKFYDEIAVKAMQRMAKKSGFRFSNTTIVDGNGYTWEKIPLIEMRDINTGMKIPGESTIPVYKKGGIVNKKMVKK